MANCRAAKKEKPRLFKNLAATTDKPILAFARSTYSCTDESRTFQEEAGIPFLQAIKPTLRALAGLGLYGERKGTGIPPLPAATGKAEELDGEKFNQILQSKGLTLPRQALVGTAAEAGRRRKRLASRWL